MPPIVTLPLNVEAPLTLTKPAPVIPYPTGTSAPNVVAAPVPALFVNVPALILPPIPVDVVIPVVLSPRISGTKSSPSVTIRSTFSSSEILHIECMLHLNQSAQLRQKCYRSQEYSV